MKDRTLKEFRHDEGFLQREVGDAVGASQARISYLEGRGAICTYNYLNGALAIYERGLLVFSGTLVATDDD